MHLYSAFIQSASQYCLTFTRSWVNARREQLGLGALLQGHPHTQQLGGGGAGESNQHPFTVTGQPALASTPTFRSVYL